jgi:hypothetical protein
VWERINSFNNSNAGVTRFARSTDGGRTWEPARDIYSSPNNDTNIGHQILVRPDGTLIDLFTEVTSHGNSLGLQLMALRSTDKGLTWSAPIVVSSLLPAGASDPDTGQDIDVADFLAHYAVDPNNGNLYAVWPDGRFSGFQYNSIAFTMSTDGGLTWSAPVRINQAPDAVPAGNRQAFLPSVAVANDGTAAVTYYDFRNNTSAPGVPTDFWLVRAHPSDGLTDPSSWHDENRLTNASFDFEQAASRFGSPFVGDYEGLAAAGNSFLAVWTQPQGSDSDSIFFRDPPPVPTAGESGSATQPGSQPPDSQTVVPFRGHGSGGFTDASGDFFATGIATHQGAFTHSGTLVLTPTDDPLVFAVSGRTVYQAANGDLLYAVTDGTLNVLTGVVTGTDTWDGGTGRFADASGVVDISAQLLPDGSVTFSLLGNIAF